MMGNSIRPALGRVLVVDDSDAHRHLISALIESLGFVVRTARGGAEGAAIAGAEFPPPVAIVMDMEMGDVDGAAAARLIRALPPPFGDPPIIGASADARAATRERALLAGMNDFLVKPFDREGLRGALARVGVTGHRDETTAEASITNRRRPDAGSEG